MFYIHMKIIRLKITLMGLPNPVPLTLTLSILNYRLPQQNLLTSSIIIICQSLLSSKAPQVVPISRTTITSNTAETLCIIIDSELNLKNHLNFMCNKVSIKINAFGYVINNCMTLGKRKILM